MGKLLGGLGLVAVATFAVAMFFTGAAPVEYGWASMPAEIDGVLHVDMQALTGTPFYRELLEREAADGAPSTPWDELTVRTGFDPRTDLRSVTIGGLGNLDDPASTVYAIVRGRFDRERLFEYFDGEIAIERATLDGLETWSFEHDGANGTWTGRLAWVADDTVVLGSAEQFQAMLAALAGDLPRVEGTLLGKNFAALDGQLRFAMLVPESFREEMARTAAASPTGAMTAPLQTVESVLFDLEVDTGLAIELSLATDTAENGARLYEMLNGFLAMGKMFAAQRPEAAEALEALSVQHDGARVSLMLSLTGEQVWAAVDKERGQT